MNDELDEGDDLEDWPTPLGRQPKSYLYLIAGVGIAFFVGMGILMVLVVVMSWLVFAFS